MKVYQVIYQRTSGQLIMTLVEGFVVYQTWCLVVTNKNTLTLSIIFSFRTLPNYNTDDVLYYAVLLQLK